MCVCGGGGVVSGTAPGRKVIIKLTVHVVWCLGYFNHPSYMSYHSYRVGIVRQA